MEWSLIAVAVVLAALFYTQESASSQQLSTPPPRRSVYSDMHAHQNVIPLKHA